METKGFVTYEPRLLSAEDTASQAKAFRQLMAGRRSLRFFSERPVPAGVIEDLVMTAASAPSGAHKQPWFFAAVGDARLKSRIREAAEKEEFENYHGRMGEAWLDDLKKFDTNHIKPFLETAPWLIVIFKKPYELAGGEKKKNYYVQESVGIAAGLLIAAIHQAGLVTLTHTPSPMHFLSEILGRPEEEKAFLLLPVGYPAEGAQVPDLQRKSPKEVFKMYV
jgi:nitroreductase